MKRIPPAPLYRRPLAALCVAASLAAGGCRRDVESTQAAGPPEPTAAAPGSSAPEASPTPFAASPDEAAYAAAIARVEEVRGSAGRIEVPAELRHYQDRRRFLAVQLADATEQRHDRPHDEAALAQMILAGKVVELPPLGDGFVLYDIGQSVVLDPLKHFDAETGVEVPLLESEEEWRAEDERLAELARGRGRAAAQASEQRRRLSGAYGDPEERQKLFREFQAVQQLASDFGGRPYDLGDAEERRAFQVRLMSFVHPATRDVILALARSYHERFDRPLPVSSLIRTERYQRRLAGRNPNATRVPLPPHTTGMAFDVSYKYMTNEEQNFLMDEVARLEDSGRVEALRENRNTFHVYAFADGGPPSDDQVVRFLPVVSESHPRAVRAASAAAKRKPVRVAAKAAAKKPRTGRRTAR